MIGDYYFTTGILIYQRYPGTDSSWIAKVEVVFIPGVGFMPTQSQAIADEARLLYVAMTRAMNYLELSGDRNSAFVAKLLTVNC